MIDILLISFEGFDPLWILEIRICNVIFENIIAIK